MGLKIRQKYAILKLKGILFNHVSASKLYVVFDGTECMVHKEWVWLTFISAGELYDMVVISYIAQLSYTKDIIVRRRRINAYRTAASRRIFDC